MSNNKKTIIFDYDGTIADTFPLSAVMFNKHAAAYGLPGVHPEDYDTIREMGMKAFFQQLKISPLKLIALVQTVQNDIRNSMDQVQPFAGLPEVLQQLAKTYQMAIVTSNQQDIVEDFLRRHQMTSLFAEVHSEKNLFGKGPVIKKVVKSLSSLDNSVYVGDEVRDIEAATSADIPTVAVTWGFDLDRTLLAAHPAAIAHTPTELAQHVTRILG